MATNALDIKEIFLAAAELPSAERSAYLDRVLGDQIVLRRRVESLLNFHDEPGDFTGVYMPVPNQSDSGQEIGTSIGPYKLLQQIGEGGMGVVYMAEQMQPVHRQVALKLIKAGMDSQPVIARFEVERQALAMMDHVNIARVIDAGTTEKGRPYFVMELVHGVPITKYCDEHHLTPRERLELFVSVCQAIQHAHQKGIIHRDIKPSNVMVTVNDGRPVPKVIDFGVAKATDQRLTERTQFTQFGMMIGTLEYMSPEQAEMNAAGVDTRSDIFSLGVLLYELLTGSTPISNKRLKEAGFAEVLRLIKEEEPPKPSTRLGDSGAALASISALRQMEPAKLTKLLRGELDWIVMKCLEKDRNHRYATANGLAADLNRYLNDEAVIAAPTSTAYRVKKFMVRNRGPVLASAGILFALIAGIIGTTVGLIGQMRQRGIAEEQRAAAQRQEAEAEKMFRIAQSVIEFQDDMFRAAQPDVVGEKVTVVDVMLTAVKKLDSGKLKDEPIAEANVRSMIGMTLHALGRYKEAEPNLRRMVELRRKAFPPDHWSTPGSLQSLADTLQSLGQYQEAESLLREALKLRRANLPAGHRDIAETLSQLGGLLQDQDRFAEAETLCREALVIQRGTRPPSQTDIASTLNRLAIVLARSQRLAEAEPFFREVLTIHRNTLPPGDSLIGQSLNNLATVLQEQGKLADAESLQMEGLELRRKILPAGHPDIAQSLKNLAVLRAEQNKWTDAEPLARESLLLRRRALPAGHKDIASSLQILGTIMVGLRKYAESEAALLEAEQILSAGHEQTAGTHNRCVEEIVRLYGAWNQSEPGKGYDAKADQWRKVLESRSKPKTDSPPK